MLTRYWRIQTQDQDLIISPEDAQLARRKRRIIVIGSVVLVLAILFGVFGRRPGNAIKAWQAQRHAQKAFAFINKEQWDDGRSEAMAAYRLGPNQPDALRAVARYLTRLHSMEALDFWKELSKKTSLTRSDVRDEAMIAIIAGDIALADNAMDELIDAHAEPEDWLLAAQLAIQKNLPDEAKSYLAKIVADSRDTKRTVPGNVAATVACRQQPERAHKCSYAPRKTSRGENRDIARRACCCCAKHAFRTC